MTTYKLEYPITIEDQLVEEVTLRRAKGRDLRAMDKAQGDTAKALVLICKLASLSETAADELDAVDVTGLSALVGDLIAPGKKPTG